jgi:hypothetical protein
MHNHSPFRTWSPDSRLLADSLEPLHNFVIRSILVKLEMLREATVRALTLAQFAAMATEAPLRFTSNVRISVGCVQFTVEEMRPLW